MATTDPIINISPTTNDLLLRVLNDILSLSSTSSSFRNYMEERDAEYYRDTVKTKEGKTIHRPRGDITVPLVFPQVDSARGRLTTIFLANEPIFEVVSPPDLAEIASQYNAIYSSDSRKYKWKSALSKFFLATLKYNLGAVEVVWETEYARAAANLNEDTITQDILYSGNKLSYVDLYNAYWDTSVAPNLVHSEGDFAGYVSLYSPTRLANLLYKLNIPESKYEELYKSYPTQSSYYFPVNRLGNANLTEEESAIYFDLPLALSSPSNTRNMLDTKYSLATFVSFQKTME